MVERERKGRGAWLVTSAWQNDSQVKGVNMGLGARALPAHDALILQAAPLPLSMSKYNKLPYHLYLLCP